MKIEFSKEDREEIARIARKQFYRIFYEFMEKINLKSDEDIKKEFLNWGRI